MALEYAVFKSTKPKECLMSQLTTKQKQYLKGLAHGLKPVVILGANGLTEGVLAEIELALEHHELIKVKAASEDREMKRAIMDAIARETGAAEVQTIGHIQVLYRPSEKRKIELPKGR
ncbi:RNA-binding protein [Ferrimonas marina]|uniref:RNA-binding protein n=2 Tax=Ferrimonas marina TaxID=299255 RepID=A0A1M5VBE9_9GAMM|nr:RNA-binding protein [Ferrimonas marina]